MRPDLMDEKCSEGEISKLKPKEVNNTHRKECSKGLMIVRKERKVSER